MANTPNYSAIPKNGVVVTTGVSTNVTLFTAGANGSRIESISVNAPGAATNGLASIYLVKAGTSYLYHSFSIIAVSAQTTTPNWNMTIYEGNNSGRFPISLASGETIEVNSNGGGTIHWVAIGADL